MYKSFLYTRCCLKNMYFGFYKILVNEKVYDTKRNLALGSEWIDVK